MSNATFNAAAYIEGGITTMSVTTLQNPGDLGRRFSLKDHSLTVGSGAIKSHGTFKTFQIIKRDASDGVTSTIGDPAFWMDRTVAGNQFVVTADMSDSGGAGHFAGVFLGAYPADGKYGIIQVEGMAPCHVTAGTPTTAGLIVYPSGDNAFTCADDAKLLSDGLLGPIAGFTLTAMNASVGGGTIGAAICVIHLCPPQVE
jgi:hypothetical protein